MEGVESKVGTAVVAAQEEVATAVVSCTQHGTSRSLDGGCTRGRLDRVARRIARRSMRPGYPIHIDQCQAHCMARREAAGKEAVEEAQVVEKMAAVKVAEEVARAAA